MDHEMAFSPVNRLWQYLNKQNILYATLNEVIEEFGIEPHKIADPREFSKWDEIYYYTFDEMAQNESLLNFFGFIKDDDPTCRAKVISFYSNGNQIINFNQQIEYYKENGFINWNRQRI